MRKIDIVAAALLFSAFSAQATSLRSRPFEHFKCAETAQAALAQNRPQYAVFVTEFARITDGRVIGRNDYANRVRVSVLARNPIQPNSAFALIRPTFEAVSKAEDVAYVIDASRQAGFSMFIFLDELDQTTVRLNGIRGPLHMNCSRAG